MNFYNDIFKPAQRIVMRKRNRQWYWREFHNYPFHPTIETVLKQGQRPRNWQLLLLEHPHRSTTDPSRVAYTRDEKSGEADRQVITTLGKYLTRHFDLPDHVIRDIVALDTSNADRFVMLNTVTEMVDAVQRGPHSCMCWAARDFVRCTDGVERHPYAAYDPAYGWHMAVRMSGNDIVGRALLNVDSDNDTKYFVRTYKKCPNGGYSHADEMLEAWLKSQGYVKRGCWHDGAQLAYYEIRGGDILAPYIDGDTQEAELRYDGTLVISCDGEYRFNNTDGTADSIGRCTCEACGTHCHDDDITYVGYHEDYGICRSCLENDYVYATGRRGREYYETYNDCVEVDGAYYVTAFLRDNSIVKLANGDHCHMDDAVMCDDDEEWYRDYDEDIIYCDYDNKYHHIDNCVNTEDEGWVHQDDAWQCFASDKYYSDNTESVTIDGEKYHPDHAPEQDEDQQELFNTQE